jgi:hypothetical protein
VVLAVVDGQRYLVSMLGENIQWVQMYVQQEEEQFSVVAVARKSN